MIPYPVVRIDLLQSTVKSILEEQLGIPIGWGQSDFTRLPRPFGRLDIISGPSRFGVRHEWEFLCPESDFLVDVPSPAIGSEHLVRVNGVPLRHTATDTSSVTLRDALIALINADLEPATAVDTSPTQFRITETAPGSIIDVQVSSLLSVSPDPGSTQIPVRSHRDRSEVTIGFQVFADTNKVSIGAAQIMSRVPLILDLDSTLDILSDQRITLQDIAGPTDLTDLEGGGAKHESRSSMDFLATITSLFSEPASIIETVEGQLVVGSNTAVINVPA